jgi:hypothetical protein
VGLTVMLDQLDPVAKLDYRMEFLGAYKARLKQFGGETDGVSEEDEAKTWMRGDGEAIGGLNFSVFRLGGDS